MTFMDACMLVGCEFVDISTETKRVKLLRVKGGSGRSVGRVIVTPLQGPKMGKEQEYTFPMFAGYWTVAVKGLQ